MNSETPVTHRGRGRGQWMQGQDHKELRRPRIDDKIGNVVIRLVMLMYLVWNCKNRVIHM